MHIETFCPKCNARLHTTNFKVGFDDDDQFAQLFISCWQCTWTTDFKIERFNMEEAG